MRRGLIVVPMAGLMAACSTTSLDAAKRLAVSGSDSARSGAAFISAPRRGYDAYVTLNAYASALPPRVRVPPPGSGVQGCRTADLSPQTAVAETNLDASLAELDRIGRVFTALDAAYAGLGALASYDASGTVERRVGELGATVNAYARGPAIPANVSGVLGRLGGLGARRAQEVRVKAASALIRVRLEAFVAALRTRKTTFTGIVDEETRTGASAAQALWRCNLLDARPLLAAASADLGFDIPKDRPITAADPVFSEAVPALLQVRRRQQSRAAAAAFDALIVALDALIEQHRTLERGEPLDLGRLSVSVQGLQDLVDQLRNRR